MSEVSEALIGESFIGDGAEAAHINMLQARSRPANPYYEAADGARHQERGA